MTKKKQKMEWVDMRTGKKHVGFEIENAKTDLKRMTFFEACREREEWLHDHVEANMVLTATSAIAYLNKAKDLLVSGQQFEEAAEVREIARRLIDRFQYQEGKNG